jgi:predicted secreted hydrolase
MMNRPDLRRPVAGRLALGIAIAAGLIAALAIGLLRLAAGPDPERVRATISAAEALAAGDTAGYARATRPRPFQVPEDHGSHPEYRTEWWYVTGNVAARDGRAFGFQVTFFRNALAPHPPDRASAWSTNQLWMAHFALSDLEGGRHFQAERLARGAVGLAGAALDPFRVWLEEWELDSAGAPTFSSTGSPTPTPAGTATSSAAALGSPDVFPLRLFASEGGAAVDLVLEQGKPPVAQGEGGLSPKGPDPGNASHYFSWTRMPVRGAVVLDGTRIAVEGLAWMDREWSTSALGEEHVGWDWFALQLDDGRELMFFELRRRDGRPDPFDHGALVERDGTHRTLGSDDVEVEVLEWWRSPLDATEYPSGWRIRVLAEEIELLVTPRLRNQEMNLSIRYWEGAVAVEGTRGGAPLSGTGHVELTGYGEGEEGRGVRSLQP